MNSLEILIFIIEIILLDIFSIVLIALGKYLTLYAIIIASKGLLMFNSTPRKAM